MRHLDPRSACLAALLTSVIACAHRPPPKQESFDEQIRRATRPTPADLQDEVTRAEQLGELLHTYDAVAWLATDAMLESSKSEAPSVGGYLVLPEGDETTGQPSGVWQAIFYSRGEPAKVLYRVRVRTGAAPEVQRLDPPEDPVAGMDVLIRARATAIASLPHADQPLNPVLLPGSAIGEAGVLVYLLAGTTMPRHAVFGRHHRIVISEDGTRVVRAEPLSKSALVMPIDPPEGAASPAEALIVSHLVGSAPVETHVLVSLQHRMRVLVATDRGDWLVDGAKITYLGPREE
jgi:hypothetical protein